MASDAISIIYQGAALINQAYAQAADNSARLAALVQREKESAEANRVAEQRIKAEAELNQVKAMKMTADAKIAMATFQNMDAVLATKRTEAEAASKNAEAALLNANANYLEAIGGKPGSKEPRSTPTTQDYEDVEPLVAPFLFTQKPDEMSPQDWNEVRIFQTKRDLSNAISTVSNSLSVPGRYTKREAEEANRKLQLYYTEASRRQSVLNQVIPTVMSQPGAITPDGKGVDALKAIQVAKYQYTMIDPAASEAAKAQAAEFLSGSRNGLQAAGAKVLTPQVQAGLEQKLSALGPGLAKAWQGDKVNTESVEFKSLKMTLSQLKSKFPNQYALYRAALVSSLTSGGLAPTQAETLAAEGERE